MGWEDTVGHSVTRRSFLKWKKERSRAACVHHVSESSVFSRIPCLQQLFSVIENIHVWLCKKMAEIIEVSLHHSLASPKCSKN